MCRPNGTFNPCLKAQLIKVGVVFDVGGSTITAGLIPYGAASTDDILCRHTRESQKGWTELSQLLQVMFRFVCEVAHQNEWAVSSVVTVAMPGRFIGPTQSVVSPGSAAQLNAVNGELDGVDMMPLLRSIFDGRKVMIINDAIAQFYGGVKLNFDKCKGKKVAYIGIGTGLGGGIGYVTQGLNLLTDGHIFDIQVTRLDGSLCMAEDVLSGRAFYNRIGMTPQYVNQHAQWTAEVEDVIYEMGDVLSQLMEMLYHGEVYKCDAAQDWDLDDLETLKGTGCFLIGGSIGTKGELSNRLLSAARQRLNTPFQMIVITDATDAALWGAWQMSGNLQ